MGRTWTARAAGLIVALSCAGFALPAIALAKPYTPPTGKIFHGVSDTGNVEAFYDFQKLVKAHSAVMQSFEVWGQGVKPAIARWHDAATRGIISLSTHAGNGVERISPLKISRGRGDGYLLELGKVLAAEKHPTYIRLFPEMNGHWNQYSAFDWNGASRPAHTTRQFRRSWRRIVLVLRGGKVSKIDAKLRRMGMLELRFNTRHSPYRKPKSPPRWLPKPKIAFMWVPQTHGSPNISANAPSAYWPGRHYVDWIGADMYSRFENFSGFNRFLKDRRWRGLPFVVGEYAPWGEDDRPFVRKMFRWVRKHERARMLVYYQDFGPDTGNPFRLQHFPRVRREVKNELNSRYFRAFAPGLKRRNQSGGVRK